MTEEHRPKKGRHPKYHDHRWKAPTDERYTWSGDVELRAENEKLKAEVERLKSELHRVGGIAGHLVALTESRGTAR